MSYNTILATAPLTTQNYHLKMIGTSIGNSLIWDNGTNVGIGNQGTTYTLDVSGTGRFLTTSTTPLIIQTTGGNCGMQMLTSSTTTSWLVAAQYSTANTFEITPSTAVGGQTYSTPALVVKSTGNVGIGTTTPTNGKLEIQTGVTTAGLWVQTGGTTSSYVIADFRTGTNLSALKILGNGSSEFGGSLTVGKLFSNYNGSQFINTSSGLVNYIDLSTIMSNHDSAIISIGQGNDNKLAKATVIVQRTAYTSGVTYSVATLGTQPIAAYLSFAISGSYLQMQTTSANATYYYNALVIPAYS